MFDSPDIIFYRDPLFCSSAARITVLNVKRWPSFLSAFNLVLNGTLGKFITIWRLLSSTKAEMLRSYIIFVIPYSPCNSLHAYKQCSKTFRYIIMWFSTCNFQPPRVMVDHTSIVGFRTILFSRQQQNDAPTLSLLFNPSTFPAHT